MLEHLGDEDAANLVMESIAAVLAAGTCRTLDLGGDARTTDVRRCAGRRTRVALDTSQAWESRPGQALDGRRQGRSEGSTPRGPECGLDARLWVVGCKGCM
jgi:hypothetical protein